MPSLLLWLIVTLLFTVGLAGTVIPLVPGIALILGGVLLYAFVTGFTTISVPTVVGSTLLAAIAWLADYYAGALGAKAAGGGKLAALGTFIGALVGIIGGPAGLLIGAFIGALIGALLEGKDGKHAHKIAFVSLIATAGATVVQFVIGVSIIIAFLIAVFV